MPRDFLVIAVNAVVVGRIGDVRICSDELLRSKGHALAKLMLLSIKPSTLLRSWIRPDNALANADADALAIFLFPKQSLPSFLQKLLAERSDINSTPTHEIFMLFKSQLFRGRDWYCLREFRKVQELRCITLMHGFNRVCRWPGFESF